MKYYLVLFSLLLLLASCTKSEFLNEGDFFHLSNDGTKLPIWVKGNFDSDVILISVHGGPGDSGMEMTIARGFQYLEEKYMCAYWDQRFSGMAQGHPDKSTMNFDQFVDDTEKVVQLIQQKYPGKKLFILGHSWGGQLSAGYLGRENHDINFKGWIDLDGSIYGDLEAQLMKEWILERVPAKLQEPDADVAFWQFIIDWYNENPNPGNYSDVEPYFYVSALKGDAYDWDAVQAGNPTPYIDLIFKSMFSMSYYTDSFGDKTESDWLDALNLTPELGNINIPVLMLWGADDGIVPAKVADYVYDHLATDPSMKKVVKIDKCAHGPQHEQPEIFFQEIQQFIETYK